MTVTAITTCRELAHRTGDGIEVTLFWTKATNTVAVAVLDTRSGEALEFEVDGTAALDAFNHPYAYAAVGAAHNLTATGMQTSRVTLATDF
jgi:hypothetical protein